MSEKAGASREKGSLDHIKEMLFRAQEQVLAAVNQWLGGVRGENAPKLNSPEQLFTGLG